MNIIVTEKNKDVINKAVNMLIEKQWHDGHFKDALRTAMLVYGATEEDVDVLDTRGDDPDVICNLTMKYISGSGMNNQEEENPYLAEGVHAADKIDQFFKSGIISAGTINGMFQSEVFLDTIVDVHMFRDYCKWIAEGEYAISIEDAMDYFNERYGFFNTLTDNSYYEYGWTLDKVGDIKAIRVRTKDGDYKWSIAFPDPVRICSLRKDEIE